MLLNIDHIYLDPFIKWAYYCQLIDYNCIVQLAVFLMFLIST